MKKLFQRGVGALLICSALLLSFPIHVEASNPKVGDGALERAIRGSTYWQSSNLREWLNSDRGPGQVRFTNQAPTQDKLGQYAYAHEPGFLYEFTTAEKNAIAVTEHRVLLSGYDSNVAEAGSLKLPANYLEGPSLTFAMPGLIQEYTSYYYQKVNDKVFLLNPYEIQKYLQQRGWSLKKKLTSKAKQKHGISTEYWHWWSQSTTGDNGREFNYSMYDDENNIAVLYAKDPSGVVPAIQLKPDTNVGGKQARFLKIGDTVTFGRYLGEPIVWRVININRYGYPLLLSEYILDVKPFDAPGDDFSYQYSNHISFPKADSSIFAHDHYRTINDSSDTTPPTLTLLNEEEMFKRQNGSFVLRFRATDNQSGVRLTILPNGTIVTSSSFNYTITENKKYLFKTADWSDNYVYTTLPIGNINPPSYVIVEPSTTEWTNQDVTVEIFASNDVGFTIKQADQYGRDVDFQVLPNFTTYAGKRFRISGSVELINAKINPTWQQVGIGFYYTETHKRFGEYNQRKVWNYQNWIRLSDLQRNGRTNFDFIFEVPETYYSELRAIGQINVPFSDSNFHVRWYNVTYELIDDEDFSIRRIILPNGTSVYQNRYTDTLTKTGTYTYRVEDTRGKITEKSVTVKIDKEGPKLDFSYDPSPAKSVEITVRAVDEGIGLKEIQLPDGTKIPHSTATFTVTKNGTYTFHAYDQLGNKSTKSITISNIDKKPPTIHLSYTPTNWTNQPIKITATASDENGIEKIITPGGSTVYGSTASIQVTKNGTYTFEAYDKVGNRAVKSITISNYDISPPEVDIQEAGRTKNKIDIRLQYGESK